MEPVINDRVVVYSLHWARPRQYGIIRGIDETSGYFLIEFEKVGIGFDGGKFLYVDSKQFTVVRVPMSHNDDLIINT